MFLWWAPVETPQPLEVSQAAVLADGVAGCIFSGTARKLAREDCLAVPLRDCAALHRRGTGSCGLRCRSSIWLGAVTATRAIVTFLLLDRAAHACAYWNAMRFQVHHGEARRDLRRGRCKACWTLCTCSTNACAYALRPWDMHRMAQERFDRFGTRPRAYPLPRESEIPCLRSWPRH